MHPHLYRLLMGTTALRAPQDDTGHTEAPPATPPTADPVDDEDESDPPVPPTPPTGTTDAEARLLKDVMKQKRAAKEAKEAADAANARVAAYGGVDPERVRQLVNAAAEAEREEAERRGEYDRVLASVREQNEANVAAIQAERDADRNALASANKQIDDLTIGRSFGDSSFLSTSTVLSPSKARRLFGDHFEIEDGEIVAYDKAKGSSNRTPLVNANGERLGFEAAIEKIVKADPDYERLAKATLRPGSGGAPIEIVAKPAVGSTVKGRNLIAAALAAKTAR